MHSIFKNQKGQFSYAIIFLVMLVALMFLFMFIIPLLQFFNVGMYSGMETMVDLSLATANDINDPVISAAMVSVITQQQTNMLASNQVTAALIGFGGIFITILVTVVFFLLSRRNVQAGQIGWLKLYEQKTCNN